MKEPKTCSKCEGVHEGPCAWSDMPARLAAAREAGAEGMQRAADHADRVDADWTEQAFAAVVTGVRAQPEPFTFESLRLRIEGKVPSPPDARAWGVVVRRAIKTGVIVKTGDYAPRASGNLTPTATYVRGNRGEGR